MSRSLPRFDQSLNRALEECARHAGEDVDAYVARAVGAQMVADMMRAGNPATKDVLLRLSDAGVFAADAMPDVTDKVQDSARLRALYGTGLLDSPPEEGYDRITRAAADALDAPFAAVSLIDTDRQFFKSSVGMEGVAAEERQTPLEESVCQYAVANNAPLILEDARTDPVFRNHPVVQSGDVVAYLGIPLADRSGHAIGTLCVFDNKPRVWRAGHIQIMTDLAQIVAERAFGAEAAEIP